MSSLAVGAPLTQATFTDFVERLRHDCVGDGVRDHWTADAFFVVQHKVRVGGLNKEYSDKRFILYTTNGTEYETPLEYWNESDDEEREALDLIASWQGDCSFLELDEYDQWGAFEDGEVEEHTVIYYEEKWETINFHFTKAAAEAFIKRKGHDYGEMRVYADAHTYGWEYNAIKQALLDGHLQFMPDVAGKDPAPDVSHIVKLLDRARSSVDYQMSAQNQNHEAGRKHYEHFQSLLGEIDAAIATYRKQRWELAE